MSAAQKLISGGWGGGRVCWLEEQGWQCGSGGSWWSAASAAAGPVPDAAAGASSGLLEPAGQAAARWTWHLEENEQEHFPLLTCGEGVSQWMVMSFYQPDAFERWQGSAAELVLMIKRWTLICVLKARVGSAESILWFESICSRPAAASKVPELRSALQLCHWHLPCWSLFKQKWSDSLLTSTFSREHKKVPSDKHRSLIQVLNSLTQQVQSWQKIMIQRVRWNLQTEQKMLL